MYLGRIWSYYGMSAVTIGWCVCLQCEILYILYIKSSSIAIGCWLKVWMRCFQKQEASDEGLGCWFHFTEWSLNFLFISYEVTSTKYTRDVYKELLISLVASLFMGFGVLFLLLWVGIYVWRYVLKKSLKSDQSEDHTRWCLTVFRLLWVSAVFGRMNQKNNTFRWNQ